MKHEIVPIIMVLKKFARTNIGNRSLRSVLARKLVNMKFQFGILDLEEMPIYEEKPKIDNKDLKEFTKN